ncbi:protein of unknown function [Kyrpidia spormannii]|uniref:Uncharacterized protein n=2 Tax=Kyrpidia spormannii TaxID=2055160 RepID=A0ACA8Z573_9BACL|nr:protein of unknown function [Kyrpidia spormannii]CAB3390451.1 protein of unknown function [Kyrpidia spormannii]
MLADKAYRNREDLRYCKQRGIRLSGPSLGLPLQADRVVQARLEQQDTAERNAIEGKFGKASVCTGLA